MYFEFGLRGNRSVHERCLVSQSLVIVGSFFLQVLDRSCHCLLKLIITVHATRPILDTLLVVPIFGGEPKSRRRISFAEGLYRHNNELDGESGAK